MKVIVTYCSGPKREDGGLMPAVDRYLSERIRDLHDQASAEGALFRILSGEFGLLAPEQPVPWYDHLLRPNEVAALARQVAVALVDLKAEMVEYHTADPSVYPEVVSYWDVMAAACRLVKIPQEVILLAGNPD